MLLRLWIKSDGFNFNDIIPKMEKKVGFPIFSPIFNSFCHYFFQLCLKYFCFKSVSFAPK